MFDPRQNHLDDVIVIPGQPVRLDDLRNVADRPAELFDPVVGVMRRLDQRKNRGRHAHPFPVEYDDAPGHIARLLQPLDAPRAGGKRKTHPLGKVAHGDARILLQKHEQLPVSLVKHAPTPCSCHRVRRNFSEHSDLAQTAC